VEFDPACSTCSGVRPMASAKSAETYDYVIIGSGFGGAVSAMRLGEKGYRVLVLERGRRYEDDDLPRTNWNIWKFLMPRRNGQKRWVRTTMPIPITRIRYSRV